MFQWLVISSASGLILKGKFLSYKENIGKVACVFVGVNVKLHSSVFNLNWKESTNIVKNLKYDISRNSVWCEGIAPLQAGRQI